MARYRTGRLGEEIKKSISNFLINRAKDPRLTNRIISISGVDVTSDGSYATIYISPLCLSGENKEEVYEDIIMAFNRAKHAIRGQLSKDVLIRHTPELIFKIDTSTDYGNKIDKILEDINK